MTTYSRTTTVDPATLANGGDTLKQAILDIDTDLTLAFVDITEVSDSSDSKIDVMDKGTANGVCDLDSSSKIPVKRFPNLPNAKVPAGLRCPVGTVTMYPRSTPPSGWMECDGRMLKQANYPDLYAVLGQYFGGTTGKFSLPDYRGIFLRGWDHGTGRDPDASSRTGTVGGNHCGTTQTSQIIYHTHSIMAGSNSGKTSNGYQGYYIAGSTEYQVLAAEGDPYGDGRPINVSMMHIIYVGEYVSEDT